MILTALLLQYAVVAISIYGAVAGGEGDSERNLAEHPPEVVRSAKLLFIEPFLFSTTVALIKLSTLILYMRIFVKKNFHLACYIIIAVFAGWYVAAIIPQIFSSSPISRAWTRPGYGRRFDYAAYLLAMAAINTVMDVSIVFMPLFVIRTLQMSRTRKASVSGVFLLGLFCIIASAVRLHYSVELKSMPTNTSVITKDTMWSFIEPSMSITAACLPTLAPLFRGGRDASSLIRSVKSVLSIFSTLSFSKKSERGSASNKNPADQDSQGAKREWLQLSSKLGRSDNISYQCEVTLDESRTAGQQLHGIVVQKSLQSVSDSV